MKMVSFETSFCEIIYCRNIHINNKVIIIIIIIINYAQRACKNGKILQLTTMALVVNMKTIDIYQMYVIQIALGVVWKINLCLLHIHFHIVSKTLLICSFKVASNTNNYMKILKDKFMNV